MENKSFISMGSNVGKREETLLKALKQIGKSTNIHILKQSAIYETEPVGVTNQAKFLNMVIAVETSFSAHKLLHFLQKIEHNLGRKREIKWGPRTIDLDILLFNDENIKSETLTIPHPHMFERGFVIIPLQELYPTILNDYNVEIYPDERGVWLWKQNIGAGELELSESLKDTHKKA